MKIIKSLLFFSALLVCVAVSARTPKISDMRCEYRNAPLGVETEVPRFTWTYTGNDPDFEQESVTFFLSDVCRQVETGAGSRLYVKEYGVKDPFLECELSSVLKPHTQYYWKVLVCGKEGRKILSDISSFETSKLSVQDWKAVWISDGCTKDYPVAPMFRKTFSVKKGIKQARLYISGLGYYYAWINGEKVGDRMLDPAYTHFDKRVYYTTYDVTSLLNAGKNSISAVLGNGWFNVQTKAVWHFEQAAWRGRPVMLGELRITYNDGSVETIGTDTSWRCAEGPYRADDIYCGDHYDAGKEIKGWQDADFDDASWGRAVVADRSGTALHSGIFDPIRASREIKPVSFRKISDRLYVYDLGENISGLSRIRVKSPAGNRITMKHGERLDDDGRVDVSNIDYFMKEPETAQLETGARQFQTDVYITAGTEGEEFSPLFNYHGFRYVEVEGEQPFEMSAGDLSGTFMHSDVAPVGRFSCSNADLNRLWEMVNRSYLSNLLGIPTDCPQREKNGWTSDACMSMDLALMNYDGISLYEKWMTDFIDNIHENGQISAIVPSSGWGYANWVGPVWDIALLMIPDALYNYYGDSRIIAQLYPTCVKYMNYIRTKETPQGVLQHGLGDWMAYKARTPGPFTSACFYYHMNNLMDRFAKILNINDGGVYAKKAQQVRDTINSCFLDKETGIYATGSMTSQAVPLYLGIVPENLKEKVAANLAEVARKSNYSADFGHLGTKVVLRALSENGYYNEAYRMASQPELPGWVYWIRQGKTSLLESWNPQKKGLSYNHVFFGDISAWMYNYILGINFDRNHPGFSHFVVRPCFMEGLDWAEGEYRSVKGAIAVKWSREKGRIRLQVSVPTNTTATVYTDRIQEVAAGKHEFIF